MHLEERQREAAEKERFHQKCDLAFARIDTNTDGLYA